MNATATRPVEPDLSVEDVQRLMLAQIQPITDVETVSLHEALDRVLAQDITSPLNVPPHDNSAMDGYAFNGTCLTQGGTVQLTVVGTALAGKAWSQAVSNNSCVKIMTGAIMPAGLDTVVPTELTERDGDSIRFEAAKLTTGANRRRAGEDLTAGQPALCAGQRLSPAAVGLLASLGLQHLPVFRRLRVACFSTGDEILSLGEPPREGAVYDSNRYTLNGLLTRMGIEVMDLGAIPDHADTLRATFERAAKDADAIVTSGGVSMGDADHTRATMKALGQVDFWRIAMRPGRPMAFGRLNALGVGTPPHACLFGLPGNPVAAMVTFLVLVRPALLRLMGCTAPAPVMLRARCEQALKKRPGRSEYPRAVVQPDAQGQLCVRTTGPQGSGLLSSMVQANGLIALSHEQGDVNPGDPVDVMMFDGVM